MIPLAAISAISLGTAVVGLLAVGGLYALHYLRIQPERQPVATLIFWRTVARQQNSRALWSRQFRYPRTFALLATIVAMLALALSADRWQSGTLHADAVVIDCGSSMGRLIGGRTVGSQLTADHGTTFDAARKAAVEQILSANVTPAVIVAGEQPEMISPANEPSGIIRQRLDSLQPSMSGSTSALAIQLSQSVLSSLPNASQDFDFQHGAIDWYTDQQQLPCNLPIQIASRVRLHHVQSANAATIAAVMFEPDRSNPDYGHLHVEIASNVATPTPATVEIVASRDATQRRSITITDLPQDVVFDSVSSDGSDVTAHLAGAPGTGLEQTVKFQLPRRAPLVFTIVGDVPTSMQDVLQAIGTIASPHTAGAIPVIESNKDDDRAGGPAIRIVANGSGTASGELAVADPADGDLALEQARVSSASPLATTARPILTVNGQAVLGLDSADQVLEISSALLDASSDLPKRAAFPVLMQRLCGRLAGWEAASPAVESQRAVNDPLWTQIVKTPNACVVYAGPLTEEKLKTASQTLTSAATAVAPAGNWFARFSWTNALLLVGFLLVAVEGALVAGKKIV